ncbi:proline iminopeptidase-family hydrolase [Gramella sp. GC03-9]|uniref:Proline iminopeptidase-family hydrolase n=1 Tax=Christiangramia oceanisediminis TaxID=2920386 RepID=A0A9X2KVV4_9FLAO|nr:proline iminopeptidase-family hydrolase [Gramella oceanisediminis]MCP9198823.1 proline iminopeptidase-family hydrolase [Gramella oceanisediminis]
MLSPGRSATGILLTIFLFLICSSCRKEVPTEGFVEVEGGKIWYKVVGKGEKTPLLILHGGPGSRSCTMMPGYSRLGDERKVIFYDQLGSGSSDRPQDTMLWRRERFVDEIEILREELDLEELHILGQSWGGALLSEYMITREPKGVRSVIFSSPLLSTRDWMDDARLLLSQMPQPVQDTIRKYEALKEYSKPVYLAAVDSFYSQHLSRRSWPREPVAECEGVGGFNSEVYNYMWGPTEFTATGTLLDFDRTDDLDEIEEPILFIAGEYDEARPETMYEYQKLSKNARVEIIEDAAHSTVVDQPEKVSLVISDFLKSVENSSE